MAVTPSIDTSPGRVAPWQSTGQTRLILSWFLGSLFILYAVNPVFFERRFYLNEILALAGGCMFLARGLVLWRRGDAIYNFVTAFIFLGLIVTATSVLGNRIHVYGFLRHSVIVYSAFAFFLGEFLALFLRKRLKVKSLLLLTPFHPVAFLPLSVWGFAPFVRRRHTLVLLVIASFTFVFMFKMGQTTILASTIALSLLLLLPFRVLVGLGLASLFAFALTVPYFYQLYLDFVSSDIFSLMARYPELGQDGNATVRLLMWGNIVFDVVPKNLLGIGFGVPLFNLDMIQSLSLIGAIERDPYIEYTLAAHNSFLSLAARMGLPFVLLSGAFIYRITRLFKARQASCGIDEYAAGCAFFLIAFASFFNVVLESPLHSGLFWGLLGVYHAFVAKGLSPVATAQPEPGER